MDEHRVIHVVPGKGKETIASIKEHLAGKGVMAAQIKEASMDLSPAYIAGVAEHFPKAQITFDRFHVVKLLNEAMDQVRKSERADHIELQGHKYTLLKNPQNLSAAKRQELEVLVRAYPNLGEAYRLQTLFNDLWTMPSKEAAGAFLNQWFDEVDLASIPAFGKFSKTVKAHWDGIIRFAESRLTNGILEGINHKVQLAKRRARGYRNIQNFINMIYFLCGKLKFSYPLYFT
jgi:transposase